jgi:hypothetical protein
MKRTVISLTFLVCLLVSGCMGSGPSHDEIQIGTSEDQEIGYIRNPGSRFPANQPLIVQVVTPMAKTVHNLELIIRQDDTRKIMMDEKWQESYGVGGRTFYQVGLGWPKGQYTLEFYRDNKLQTSAKLTLY